MGSLSCRQGSAALSHVLRATRHGIALVAALVVVLLAAAPAMGATVSVSAGGVLTYDAVLGETNTVSIEPGAEGALNVTETTAPLSAGSGCTGEGATVSCTGASRISVNVRDLDDTVVVAPSVTIRAEVVGQNGVDRITGGGGPDHIEGRGSIDVIDVRGGGRDRVICIDGDQVTSDASDSVEGPCVNDNGVPPESVITSAPPRYVGAGDPTFSFEANEAGTFTCTLSGPGGDSSGPCGSPHTVSLPSEGDYIFSVTATDEFGNVEPTPASHAVTVDTTAPEVIVTRRAPFDTSTAHFQLDAVDPAPVTFSCRIGSGDAQDCADIFTTPILADGEYTLFVTGTDAAGNATPVEVPFRINAVQGGGGTGAPTPPSVAPRRIIIESLVLIAGNPVRMSRRGTVGINLTCAGNLRCKGRMKITTAAPVSRKSRKLVTLGSKRFSIAANKKRKVTVRFSKSKRRLAKRLKRFKAKVVIHEIDQRGNPRISSRVFVLRAR